MSRNQFRLCFLCCILKLSMSLLSTLISGLVLALSLSILNASSTSRRPDESSCPFHFDTLPTFEPSFTSAAIDCRDIVGAVHLVQSKYLHQSNRFLPPLATYTACVNSLWRFLGEYKLGFVINTTCGFNQTWISRSCRNVTSRAQLESIIPNTELQEIQLYCNGSLENTMICNQCKRKLWSASQTYLRRKEDSYPSECLGYLEMYTAAFVNELGPTDKATARCLFSLEFSKQPTSHKQHRKSITFGAVLGGVIGLAAGIAIVSYLLVRRKYTRDKNDLTVKSEGHQCQNENHSRSSIDDTSLVFGFGLYGRSPSLTKFKIDEIRRATMNFSRENLVGMGGYGNVYKGFLEDGSLVAFKRFKNSSAAGDVDFVHEVEMIASVKHVNLVALRGYCTATIPNEGHQRIIVCDLIPNGSLYDHLFGCIKSKLSWPIRRKITLGTASGLAYLHHGVYPAIIHRDVKASNILLDQTFEAKVADFGLARIIKEATHLSTMVAGTFGYVAPEYALYGKLTERSDVYSFGVLVLEILSGRKAYVNNGGRVTLLADWAWELVNRGNTLDVVDQQMPELGTPQQMEQYVILAVLCCHPMLQCRPTMDQIVKILESDFQVA